MPWGVVLDQKDPEGHWQAALEFLENEREIQRKRMQQQDLGKQTTGKDAKVWKVKDYEITLYPNGTYNCTCKGFMFRKQCKHIVMVQNGEVSE